MIPQVHLLCWFWHSPAAAVAAPIAQSELQLRRSTLSPLAT